MTDPIALYHQHYSEQDFERCELFDILVSTYDIETCLYPGSYVHCTPSFYVPRCCYVDTDPQAVRFFKSASVRRFVRSRAAYDGKPHIVFHHQSYERPLPEPDASFDLLLSLYAGFISDACKRYLRPGGHLVVNNSHGDASLAALDEQFRFVAAVHCRDGGCRIDDSNLERYFVSKKPLEITRDYIRKMGRGIAYTKPATCYVFERVGD